MKTCENVINLGAPIRSEKMRVPFKKSRVVFIYRCAKCEQERRVFANSFRGTRAEPGVGGIVCGALLIEK